MKKNRSVNYTIIALILLAIAAFILFFINGTETRTSGEKKIDIISSVVCHTGSVDEAFFKPTLVNTIENEIKVTFKNEGLDKLFYVYKGVYRSNEVAKNDEAVLHARYNNYLGNNGVSKESLSPAFYIVDTKFYINLYTETFDDINRVTSPFFFIDKDKIDSFKTFSKEEVKAFYEKKGFKCEINEGDK